MTQYIQSVQQFEITIGSGASSNTATINSVSTSNAFILWQGFTFDGSSSALRDHLCRCELTNGTTVTASRGDTDTGSCIVRGTVIEFKDAYVDSVQQGTITIASTSTSNTATITSVTTSRSVVFLLGTTMEAAQATSTHSHGAAHLTLTDATTVTAARSGSTGALTVGYVVVEFATGVTDSVQPRTVTLTSSSTSSTDTITSVTQGDTLLVYNGVLCSLSSRNNYFYNLELTAATTVTLTRTGTSTTSRTIKYTALEFAAGVLNTSVQRGNTPVNSATSADEDVGTSVSTTYGFVNWTHFSTDGSGPDEIYATAKLFDTNTVRSQKGVAGTTGSTPGWEVIEFTQDAGGNLTLTAAQGTYTLTGQAATLTETAILSAAQGSYTLTGQAASLIRTYPLVAAQGAYTLTGQAATLTWAQVLTAAQGTYTITGQAAALTQAFLLTAAQGSYTITGQDAGFLSGTIFSADQGSYTLTGQAATFLQASVLTAEQGTYSLTGQAATFTLVEDATEAPTQAPTGGRITRAGRVPRKKHRWAVWTDDGYRYFDTADAAYAFLYGETEAPTRKKKLPRVRVLGKALPRVTYAGQDIAAVTVQGVRGDEAFKLGDRIMARAMLAAIEREIERRIQEEAMRLELQRQDDEAVALLLLAA